MLLTGFFFSLSIVAPALATLSSSVTTATETELKCTTYYGSKSATKPIATTTSTKTKVVWPWFGTSVYTPIATVTPKPITTTSAVEETTTVTVTDNAVTDVFSTTLTEFTTTTTTAVESTVTTRIDTFTATETGPESTSVIPTSTGFLPIESTVATAFPNAPSRRHNAAARGQSMKRGGDLDCLKGKFPKSVECTRLVELHPTTIYIRTAATSTITLPAATSTSLSTTTITSTSTVVPPSVSTTVSFTDIQTVSETTTSTDISTSVTSTTSTLTLTHTTSVYAACTPSSGNLMGPGSANGYLLGISGSNSFAISKPGSAYNCCVACQEDSQCAGSIYKVGPEPAAEVGQCLLIKNSQCSLPAGSASQAGFSRAYYTISEAYYNQIQWGSVWSNGNCGYLYYGGPF